METMAASSILWIRGGDASNYARQIAVLSGHGAMGAHIYRIAAFLRRATQAGNPSRIISPQQATVAEVM